MKNKQTKNMVLSGIMIALGVLLPVAFHVFGQNAGRMLLPMHLPVMVAAFFLPWYWAGAVGLLTPVLSTLLTSMPPLAPVPTAVFMPFELMSYAIVIALIKTVWVKPQSPLSPLWALIPAMVTGRVVSALVVWVAISLFGVEMASPWIYVQGSLAAGLPGIAIQIVTVPLLYHLLIRHLPGWAPVLPGGRKEKAQRQAAE